MVTAFGLGELSWYVTDHWQVSSAFYLSGVGESSTGLSGCGYGRAWSPLTDGS